MFSSEEPEDVPLANTVTAEIESHTPVSVSLAIQATTTLQVHQ